MFVVSQYKIVVRNKLQHIRGRNSICTVKGRPSPVTLDHDRSFNEDLEHLDKLLEGLGLQESHKLRTIVFSLRSVRVTICNECLGLLKKVSILVEALLKVDPDKLNKRKALIVTIDCPAGPRAGDLITEVADTAGRLLYLLYMNVRKDVTDERRSEGYPP